MKSEIFYLAIHNRNKIRFLYGLKEVILDPYYISCDKDGRKSIYGRAEYTNEIRKYEFGRIANIKILGRRRFSPVIPIISQVS